MSDPTALDMAEEADDRIVQMVDLLMRGNTTKAVAKHFGVTERTIYRWKTTGVGKQLLAVAKRESLDRAHRAVAGASAAAASTLVEIARDPKARRGDRIRAADSILRASGVSEMGSLLAIEDDSAGRVMASETVRAKFAAMDAALRKVPPVEVGQLSAVNE